MARNTTHDLCLRLARKHGWSGGVIERWYGGYAHDWMNVADLLFYQPQRPGVLFVQSCAYERVQDHIDKLCGVHEQTMRELVQSAGRDFEIWGWKRSTKTLPRRRFPYRVTLDSRGLVCVPGSAIG